MDERLYSRPLDVHRISEYPEVQRMITYLFDEMKSSGLIGKSPRNKIPVSYTHLRAHET